MELTDRQRELADAALRIVADEGMAGVTFRSVATASGWSLGAVQKAFASKDEMYAAMFERLRTSEGVGPTTPPGEPTVREWMVDLIISVLPLDPRRRALTLQGQAFADRAAYDASIGDVIAHSDGELRGLLAHLVRSGQAKGEIAAHVDPTSAAWAIFALAHGVASQLLYDPVSRRTVTTRVRTIMGVLLPSP